MNHKIKIKDAYNAPFAKWLFCMAAVQTVAPFLINTFLLFVKKESPGYILPFAVQTVCTLAAGFALLPAVKPFAKDKSVLSFWLFGYLPYAAVLGAGSRLVKSLQGNTSGALAAVLYIAAAVLMCLAVALAIYNGVRVAVNGHGKKRGIMKSVMFFAVFTAAVYLGHYAIPGILKTAVSKMFVMGVYLPSTFTVKMLSAIAIWLFLAPAAVICANRFVSGDAAQENEASDNNKGNAGRVIFACIFIAVFASTVIFNINTVASPLDTFRAGYTDEMSKAVAYRAAGDYVTALNRYNTVCAELDAWENVLDGKDINELVSENPTDTTVLFLDAVTKKDVDGKIQLSSVLKALDELYVQNKINGSDFYYAMLSYYKQAPQLTQEQENRRTEILSRLAAAEVYLGGVVTPESLADSKDEAKETIELLRKTDSQFKYSEIMAMAQTGRQTSGTLQPQVGFTDYVVDRAFELARENPEDMGHQFMAVYALTYSDKVYAGMIDTSKYPDRLETVKRFDRLWKAQDEEISKDIQLIERQFVTKAYMTLKKTKEAAEYIAEALKEFPNDSSLTTNAMYCLYNDKQYIECFRMAEDVLKADADNTSALLYLGSAAARLKNTDKVLDCAEKLAEQVKTLDYPYYADSCLQELMFRVTMYKNSENNELEACYNDFTPEQISRLEANEFLNAYVQAYRIAFTPVGNYQMMDAAAGYNYVDTLLKVRDDIGYPYYIRGSIYYCQSTNYLTNDEHVENLNKAVQDFEKATEYAGDDAIVWYSLAEAYNRQGRYDLSYTARAVGEKLMPWQDYYGSYDDGLWHILFYENESIQKLDNNHKEQVKDLTSKEEG